MALEVQLKMKVGDSVCEKTLLVVVVVVLLSSPGNWKEGVEAQPAGRDEFHYPYGVLYLPSENLPSRVLSK